MRKPVLKIVSAFIILPALFAFFTACTNDDDTTVGPVPPNTATILFSSPTADSLYQGTGDIAFAGAISSVYPIQGYKIVLRRKTDNSVVLSKDFQDKDTLVAFNEVWQNNVTALSDLEVEVVANLDDSGNSTSEKISFQAAP